MAINESGTKILQDGGDPAETKEIKGLLGRIARICFPCSQRTLATVPATVLKEWAAAGSPTEHQNTPSQSGPEHPALSGIKHREPDHCFSVSHLK